MPKRGASSKKKPIEQYDHKKARRINNFQPFVNRRDVKDGKDNDLTQEPEMIKAFLGYVGA